MGPFGCCKGSGLCSECDGDPGECVQTSNVSSLTTSREQCVGHVLVICGCITNDPKISSLKRIHNLTFSQVRSTVWLSGLAPSGSLAGCGGSRQAEVSSEGFNGEGPTF